MVDTEYRYELKYIISDQAAELLKQQLRALMELDSHSISDGCSYTIRSLYFDDINSSAYYDKLDGIESRSKYRMRIYNGSKDVIKLECKHKDENMTYKESSSLNYEIARAVIDGRYGAIRTNDAFMNRFLAEAMARSLRPSILVEYRRLAFVYPVSEVRITFDSELRSGRYDMDLFNADSSTFETFDEGRQVLEVKCNEFIPQHILNVLSSVPLLRQAVSKFAICRSMK